jgi:hypothetical protein
MPVHARATSVKLGCHCGAVIIDQTDDLPNKGHLIPDQEWFATYDALDDELIDPLVDGKIEKNAAYWLARTIVSRSARLMYQCRECGRLYIDDLQGKLHCYLPESEQTAREILRSRQSRA